MEHCKVFIHSSIKTRIETLPDRIISSEAYRFLYIVPLKQGLKPPEMIRKARTLLFLYIVPLKQGLKHCALKPSQLFSLCFYT